MAQACIEQTHFDEKTIQGILEWTLKCADGLDPKWSDWLADIVRYVKFRMEEGADPDVAAGEYVVYKALPLVGLPDTVKPVLNLLVLPPKMAFTRWFQGMEPNEWERRWDEIFHPDGRYFSEPKNWFFSSESREIIFQIQRAFQELAPVPIEMLEEQIRKDANPQIALKRWKYLTDTYFEYVEARELTQRQRQDALKVLFRCQPRVRNGEAGRQEALAEIAKLRAIGEMSLSPEEVDNLVATYLVNAGTAEY